MRKLLFTLLMFSGVCAAQQIRPSQIIPCAVNGDVLTTVGGVTTCAPSAITGSGTAGDIPVWNSTTALGNSPLSVSSGSIFDSGTFNGQDVCWHYESGGSPQKACLRYAGHGDFFGPYNTDDGTTFTPTPFSVGQLQISTGNGGTGDGIIFFGGDTAGSALNLVGINGYTTAPTGTCPNVAGLFTNPQWAFGADETLSYCSNLSGSTWQSFVGGLGFVRLAPTSGQSVAQPLGTTLGVNNFNNIVYSNGYSTIEQTVAGCNSVYPCQIIVSSSISQSTAGTYTIPSGVYLQFVAGGTLALGGHTLSFLSTPGIITAPPVNLGLGSGTVTGLTGAVDVEWFGAVGDGVLSTGAGTDDTASIQACVRSIISGWAQLQNFTYKLTSTVTITQSNQGIKGLSVGYDYTGIKQESILMETSSSADVVDVGFGSNLQWNIFENFTIQRSVLPTGTARGLALSGVGGAVIDKVTSMDSIANFYFHGTPQEGSGGFSNLVSEWGFSVVTGYTTQTLYAYWLDSADNTCMNSIRFENATFGTNQLSTVTSYGYFIQGTCISDVNIEDTNGAFASYGLYVNYTGTGVRDTEADIHVDRPTIDSCYTTCIYISNIAEILEGFPGVFVSHGYIATNFGAKLVDIESSQGVSIESNELISLITNGASGILVNASAGCSIQNNAFSGMESPPYDINVSGGSQGNVIAGNVIDQDPNQGTLVAAIEATTGAHNNVFSHNSVIGYAQSGSPNVTSAYYQDSASQNNQWNANTWGQSGAGIGTVYNGFTAQTTLFPDIVQATSLIASGLGSSTSPVCTTTGGLLTNSGCSGGLSGMTATQVPVAATSSTVTSSIPIVGTSPAGLAGTSGTFTTGNYRASDSSGREVDSGVASAPTCNANGCYRGIGGGYIEQWGVFTLTFSSGATNVMQNFTLPTPFATAGGESITTTCAGVLGTPSSPGTSFCLSQAQPGGGTSLSTIDIQITAVVANGGAGAVFGVLEPVSWHAIGH